MSDRLSECGADKRDKLLSGHPDGRVGWGGEGRGGEGGAVTVRWPLVAGSWSLRWCWVGKRALGSERCADAFAEQLVQN